MKKFYVLLIMAMVAMTANAQVSFGIRGGINVVQLSLKANDYKMNSNNHAGWFVGPTIRVKIPVGGLSADASVLYTQTQFETTTTTTDGSKSEFSTVMQKNIGVPVNLRYTIGLGSLANIFFFAGPQFNFNIGDKVAANVLNQAEWKNTSSQICVNVGAGATLFKHFQLSVNYNHPFNNSSELKDIKTDESYAQVKTNIWQISAGFVF